MLSLADEDVLPAPRGPAGIAAPQLAPLLEWFGATFRCLPPAETSAAGEADAPDR